MLVLPVACGNGDQEAFASATTETIAEGSQATVATSTAVTSTAATSTAVTSTAVTSTTAAPATTTTTAGEVATGAVFPDSAEMLVSFTYEPSSDEQAKRPYVAVWVEDADGNLVDTISLWFDQGSKGTRWLNDLSQWYRASGGEDTTMSGATRVAGDYTVAWDGTDTDGRPVAAGEYVLNIESAREHGPTSFTSGTITIGDQGFTVDLDDDGELSGATAVLTV